jgi:L-asparaginase
MKNIQLIYTGGTFGMLPVEPSKTLKPSTIQNNLLNYLPDIKKIANIDLKIAFNLDSSNIQLYHWQELAQIIVNNYYQFDGFVIIHGTDAMVYTASALSFILQNLSKPIILTGSQRSLAEIRSDARSNLINSLELATYKIPEVCICFGNYLFRGNRAIKISNTHYNAFASPNYPALAEVGLDITISNQILVTEKKFQYKTDLSDSVFCFRFHPGLSPLNLKQLLKSSIKSVVIEALGSGNLACQENSLIPWIKEMNNVGKIIAVNSQSDYGKINLTSYESGVMAADAGALSCGDMTTTATIVKLMYLMGNYTDEILKIKDMFTNSLAGEITEIVS